MHLQQLRIGNIVQDKNKNLLSITAITHHEDQAMLHVFAKKYKSRQIPSMYEESDIWAVRIQLPVLRKLFHKRSKLLLIKNPELYLFYDFGKENFRLHSGEQTTPLEIDYLHEFQNIHFIMTGEEYIFD